VELGAGAGIMTQENVVNSIMRDMRFAGIVTEENDNIVQEFIEQAWVAGMEHQRSEDAKNRQGRNNEITYYSNNDKPLGTYKSITEASDKLIIPRGTIKHSLYGQVTRMRNGHYFRYAEQGNDTVSFG
jgi:hypothetical protein